MNLVRCSLTDAVDKRCVGLETSYNAIFLKIIKCFFEKKVKHINVLSFLHNIFEQNGCVQEEIIL